MVAGMNQPILIACLAALMVAASVRAEPSVLWNEQGERTGPGEALPDFSYAGYHRGEDPLPTLEPDVLVTDFGATPDDDTDDTAAFRKALEEAGGRTIGVPAGRFVLSDILEIDESNTLLQGAGAGETILHFTRSLEEIAPRRATTGHGTQTSAYSWSGGLIRLQGDHASQRPPQAKLAEKSEQGQSTLTLRENPYAVGDEIVITANEGEDGSLAQYLYRGDVRDGDTDIDRIRTRMIATVTAVDGNTVTLDRPLRFEARPEWITVAKFEPAVVESGVEHLTIEFPSRPYKGHFTEDGLNAIAIGNAAHSWVRDVEIVNADSGIFSSGDFITIDGLIVRSEREPDRRGNTGHHGIITSGTESLVTNFDYQTRFVHDLGLSRGSTGNVYASGRGVDLNFDHHRWAPYQNLFTDIDAGHGSRYFASGGTNTRGRHTAAGATFWNIRGEQPAKLPNSDFGPPSGLFFVGVYGLDPAEAPEGWHVEAIAPSSLVPANLYAAQLSRRLGRSPESGRSDRESPEAPRGSPPAVR